MRRYLISLILIPCLTYGDSPEKQITAPSREYEFEQPAHYLAKGNACLCNPCKCNSPGYQVQGNACQCNPCPTRCCSSQARCCANFFGFADLLVWKAKEGGLDYAITAPTPVATSIPPLAPSIFPDLIDRGSHYDPGVRLGIGYGRDWDISLYWTYFSTRASRSTAATVGSPLYPVFFNTASGPQMLAANNGSARGKWKLCYDTADLEFGYSLPCGCFSLRPHLGMRAAWINQKVDAYYNNVTFTTNPTDAPANYSGINKNDFWGVGLRAGGDGRWSFSRGFSIFGKGAITLLGGEIEVNQKEYLTSTATYSETTFPAGTLRDFMRATRHTLSSALDITGGLGWSTCCGCCEIDLSLAWEFQLWFSQNQLLNVVDTGQNFRYVVQQGDLTLQGLTAEIAVRF
ncbi:MAG: hypothetical protein JSR80_06345 [Verrucomicrobia bacterium]|nr:hypothetical protein [Verrucomicrobiota bacterium]